MIRTRTVATVAIAAVLASSGLGSAQATAPQTRPLAHIAHGDVSFSVSIDPANANVLTLVVPERSDVSVKPPRPVKVRVRFRDETTREGVLSPGVSFGSGGFTDWNYRFDAQRPMTEANLHSVTISVGSDSFEVFPW